LAVILSRENLLMLAPEDEKPYADLLAALKKRWQPVKAAVYTIDPAGAFRLKSQFGFTRTDRLSERFVRMDPLATHVYEHREPFFVNNLRQAGKLADLLESASTTKILTAPIYLDGRVIGILDVRDKAGRAPFTHDDVHEVSEILRRFAQVLKRHPQYRPSGITQDGEAGGNDVLQALDSPSIVTTALKLPAEAPVSPYSAPVFETSSFSTSGLRPSVEPAYRAPSPPEPAPEGTSAPYAPSAAQALRLVEETMARASHPKAPSVPAPGTLPAEAEFVRLFLQQSLSFPEVEAASSSVFTPAKLEITLASRRPLDPDLEPALKENLERVVARPGLAFALPSQVVIRPLDIPVADVRPLKRAEIAAIQSSVLAGTAEGVAIYSLLFRHGPSPEGREELRPAHLLLKSALAQARAEARFREAYRGLVNKLLEPGLKRRTALKTHSFNVGRLSRKLSMYLGLPPTEVEQVTVAGILHDVGMRELQYDEIYSKRVLTEDELKLVRQHPRVGAYLLEDLVWPYAVAPLVKHHHERWDGAGYPDGLKGDQIPLGARIIHIAEAFDAMTSQTSYRPVLADYQALDIIESKAGTQFDPDLAARFKKMVQGDRE
jgi:hypothetical protein